MTDYQHNSSRSSYRAARPTPEGRPAPQGNYRSTANGRSAPQGAYRSAPNGRPAANGAYRPASVRPQDVAQYQNRSRYTQHAPKKKNFKPAIITVLVLIALGVGVFVFMNTRPYTVNINGQDVDLRGDHTLLSLVEEGYVSPQPGNLLAIDNSLLETGKGRLFEATVNGEDQKDYKYRIWGGETITIGNGNDETEPTKETESAIPFEQREESGWGAIHRFEGGTEGKQVTRIGEISGIEQSEEVLAPQHKYLHNYSADAQGEKVVALTFDDGPWGDTTEQILDILAENNVKATFFVVGNLIEQSPRNAELIKRAFDDGHQICTHTYSHASGSGMGVDLSLMTDDEQVAEITKGFEAIEAATGQQASRIIRTPGGNFKENTKRLYEPLISAEMGWDVDTNDWRLPGADAIASRIKSVEPGNIVLMHDGGGDRSQTVEAVRQAIPYLKEQGFRFVTMDELLEYPAKTE